MRCLITGCAGFIGSHLSEKLLEMGFDVIGIDNFATGSELNLKSFADHPKFTLIKKSVAQPLQIEGSLDWVFHFASPASPEDYRRLAIPTLKAGALGTYYMLGVAKAKKAKFFLASTSEVYGDPAQHPQTEEYWGNVNPVGQRSMYDESKRFAEAIAMAYYREHGISIRIARIFNTYGPRMRMNDGRVVPNFIIQSLKTEPLTIYGKGSQTRSFSFIQDLLKGIVGFMQTEYHAPVNLGNPEEHTIQHLAEKIIELTGSSSQVELHPLPEDDPQRRCPDIRRARQLFSFNPTISLEKGLSETIPYFRERLT